MKYLYLIALLGLSIMYLVGTVRGLLNGEVTLSSWQDGTSATFKESPIKFVYILIVRIIAAFILAVCGLFLYAIN